MKVALYRSSEGSLVDKAINIWTGFRGYSHSEIVFEHHLFNTNNEKFLCCSSSPRENKLRFKEIDINSGNWTVIDIPEISTVEKEKEIYDFLKDMEGTPYDWKGIFFWFILKFVRKQDNKKWWCSEIVGYTLDKFARPMSYRISPNKLAKNLEAPKRPFTFKFSFTSKF